MPPTTPACAGMYRRTPLGKLKPDAPVMHRVRRAQIGDAEPPAPVPPASHLPVSPHAPRRFRAQGCPRLNTPVACICCRFSTDFIDVALTEGWYSYRVNAVEIGPVATAPQSSAAEWQQWTPCSRPETLVLRRCARLGCFEYTRDPAPRQAATTTAHRSGSLRAGSRDPQVIRASHTEARGGKFERSRKAVGDRTFRVRWLWSSAQMRGVLDTAEFRVYFQSGQPNSLTGRVTGVSAAGAGQSSVTTDVAGSIAANTLTREPLPA